MAAHFGAILDIESRPTEMQDLPRSHSKPFPAPSPLELDDFEFGQRYNGPRSGTQTPATPYLSEGDLLSRPSSPRNGEAVGVVASWSNPPMTKWRVLCACLTYFASGLTDGAPGALIPYIEVYYGISYAVMSLIFITTALGFLSTAFLVDVFLHKLGRAKTLMLAETVLVITFTIISCTPAYPLVVASFYLLGFGFAIMSALNNVFVGTLADSTVMLGFAQIGRAHV